MHLGIPSNRRETFYWQHLLAWMGGILCSLVPFVGFWEIESISLPLRFGPGNFGFNILIVIGLTLLGGILGGYWWRLCKWLLGDHDILLRTATVLLGLLSTTAYFLGQLHDVFFYLLSALGGFTLVACVVIRVGKKGVRLDFDACIDRLSARNRFNGVFFILLFLVLAISNALLVFNLEVNAMEKFSAMVGRLFMSGAVVGFLYLLSKLTMQAAPPYFRWVPWLALGVTPLIVIADQWMGIALNRRLIEFVNGLTTSGDFDPVVELAASGLDIGPVGAFCLAAGVFTGAMASSWGAWLLSKKWEMKVSLGVAMVFSVLCWMGLVAEQGLGALWKSTSSWQAEHRAFDLNIGIFAPPRGVGHYAVSFREPGQGLEAAAPSASQKRPDIYVMMIESLRADALSAKTSAFLWKMMHEECQILGETWASSNATHLSWYGFFHSQVPVFWRKTLEGIPDRESYRGAPALQWMKKSGYDIQVRAVCDLGYKDFGLLNFGGGSSLVDVWDDTERGFDYGDHGVPEREVINLNNLRKEVKKRGKGGSFYFTAFDSPHYNYYWLNSFQPPYEDYEESIRFPFNPSEEEVMRYRRRYWNSVAWIDHLMKEFCDFLKTEGRYDDAVIIVTGDHGEEFQEQGSWCHCSSLEPEQIQVPLLIKWPKEMGRGPVLTDASHLDVMPSLLDMLGYSSSENQKMTGRSLLGGEGSHTQIATTAYAGKSGETMILRRDGYQATFSWPNYWEAKVPSKVTLERLTGPDGEILLKDSLAYAEELRKIFPDAFTRFFNKFEVLKD